ncbi:MAG: hypothetical protein KDC38_01080 [Planctomycetes bacterium]|nr:hypothetical protein [Planctomycetota bacterium]
MSRILTAIGLVGAMVAGGAATFVLGYRRSISTPPLFPEVSVQRINIVDPDGTVRLVISNSSRQASAKVDDIEIDPGRHRPPGLIFFNERGDECGGLIFDGDTRASGGGFFFDQFRQDQAIGLVHREVQEGENRARVSGLRVWDRPQRSIVEMQALTREITDLEDPAMRQTRIRELEARPELFTAERVFLGRDEDSRSSLVLRDGRGRPRLRMIVTDQGEASVEFVDEEGQVTKTIRAE